MDAPIIVTSNHERHIMSLHKAQAFALAKGLPVLGWKKPLAGNITTLSEIALANIYEKRTELQGIFVQSAEENINPTHGLANGTEAYMHSVCIEEGDQPEIYRDRIRNARPGEFIEIPVPYSINVEIKFT
jgi:hypothetical protein